MSTPELVSVGNRTFVDRQMKGHKARIAQLEKFLDTYSEYANHHIRINVVKSWNGGFYQPIGDRDADQRVAVCLGTDGITTNAGTIDFSLVDSFWSPHDLSFAFRVMLSHGGPVDVGFGRSTPTEETAYHEAGHAVIGHWLGRTINQISIQGLGARAGWVIFKQEKKSPPLAEQEALTNLAGPLAGIKFNPTLRDEEISWTDQVNLDENLKLMKESMSPEGFKTTSDALTPRCQKLVDEHWEEIEAVAKMLLQSKFFYLGGSDVVRTIRKTIKNQIRIERLGGKWVVIGTDPGWISTKKFPTKWKAELARQVYLKGGQVADYWNAALFSEPRLEEVRRKYGKTKIHGNTHISVFASHHWPPWTPYHRVPFSSLHDLHIKDKDYASGLVSADLYAQCSRMSEESNPVLIIRHDRKLYLKLVAKARRKVHETED